LRSLALDLVWITPGEFDLGSPAQEASRGSDEGPQTRVRITRGYWIGRTEVTQAQWRAVMGTSPSRFKGDNLPVEQVSWNDAIAFARRLTESEKSAGRLPEGYEYTLPTEAEWEYAAKAGMTGAYSGPVDDFAWHDQNSESTRPVATKKSNAWGLHDTLGNVWEWCLDWYAPYPGGTVQDYRGPMQGLAKASRGGSWWAGPRGARPANRYRDMPHNANDDLGFRLALTAAPPGRATLSLAGTDSMAPMVRRWAELLRESDPHVRVEVAEGPPPSAAAALAAATADIGYTGRTLWEPELAAIEAARGSRPLSIRIAAGTFDDPDKTHAMAVLVHADNPLRSIAFRDLERIFAGGGGRVTWGEVGVGGALAGRTVRPIVAKLGTGATNFVRDHAFGGRDWSGNVAAHPSDQQAVAALSREADGICIAGLPYSYGQGLVRAVPVSEGAGGPAFAPTFENVVSRRYPLSRVLFVHVLRQDGIPGSAEARQFIRTALGPRGQAIARQAGYLPLTDDIVREELAKLEPRQ
jgi:ABC-type phosphate transport system substrate-binding protein